MKNGFVDLFVGGTLVLLGHLEIYAWKEIEFLSSLFRCRVFQMYNLWLSQKIFCPSKEKTIETPYKIDEIM